MAGDSEKLHAREKVVQQMGRDGLVEENLARGTVQNISSRQADFLVSAGEREPAQAHDRSQNRSYFHADGQEGAPQAGTVPEPGSLQGTAGKAAPRMPAGTVPETAAEQAAEAAADMPSPLPAEFAGFAGRMAQINANGETGSEDGENGETPDGNTGKRDRKGGGKEGEKEKKGKGKGEREKGDGEGGRWGEEEGGRLKFGEKGRRGSLAGWTVKAAGRNAMYRFAREQEEELDPRGGNRLPGGQVGSEGHVIRGREKRLRKARQGPPGPGKENGRLKERGQVREGETAREAERENRRLPEHGAARGQLKEGSRKKSGGTGSGGGKEPPPAGMRHPPCFPASRVPGRVPGHGTRPHGGCRDRRLLRRAVPVHLLGHPSADKGQRHKADSKRHVEEIKFPVRRNVCGTNRHHQKTETDRA